MILYAMVPNVMIQCVVVLNAIVLNVVEGLLLKNFSRVNEIEQRQKTEMLLLNLFICLEFFLIIVVYYLFLEIV
ncbi:hypothetical protein C2G38_2061565 [Gigaspora rosea]|uniref:Uncharacterized protein n=1 Tax=Gigaspora rosea TaxID=44941 RepID=A0A397W0I1_9GLOM|nr:hypothetical protein C2G38_2061565 [Gigaspora rosea]